MQQNNGEKILKSENFWNIRCWLYKKGVLLYTTTNLAYENQEYTHVRFIKKWTSR